MKLSTFFGILLFISLTPISTYTMPKKQTIVHKQHKKPSIAHKQHNVLLAISYGKLKEVCELLDQGGLNINERLRTGGRCKSYLEAAALGGRITMVNLLLARGAIPTEEAARLATKRAKHDIASRIRQAMNPGGPMPDSSKDHGAPATDTASMATRILELERRVQELEGAPEEDSDDEEYDDEQDDGAGPA